MSDEENIRIITPMPKSLVDAIDDYRFKNRVPSRSAAIRLLLEQQLLGRNRSAPDAPKKPRR